MSRARKSGLVSVRRGSSLALLKAAVAVAPLGLALPAMGQSAAWLNASSGNWGTGANWSPAIVPTNVATINVGGPNYTVTVASPATVFQTVLDSDDATLASSGNLRVTNTLQLFDGRITGDITVGGAAFTSLQIDSDVTGGNIVLINDSNVTEAGGSPTVNSNVSLTARATAASPVRTVIFPSQYVNRFGQTITMDAAAGSTFSSVTLNGATIQNAGTMNVAGGSTDSNDRSIQGLLRNTGSGTFTTSVDVDISSVSQEGGVFNSGGNAVTATTFSLTGGTVNAGGATTVTNEFSYNSGTLNGEIKLGNPVSANSPTLRLGVNANSGDIRFIRSGSITRLNNQGGNVQSGLAVIAEANLDSNFRTVSLPSSFSNSGAFNMTATADTFISTVTVSGNQISNSGQWQMASPSAGLNLRQINGTFTNELNGIVSMTLDAPGAEHDVTMGSVINNGQIFIADDVAFQASEFTQQLGAFSFTDPVQVLSRFRYTGGNVTGEVEVGTLLGPSTVSLEIGDVSVGSGTYTLLKDGAIAQVNGQGGNIPTGMTVNTRVTVDDTNRFVQLPSNMVNAGTLNLDADPSTVDSTVVLTTLNLSNQGQLNFFAGSSNSNIREIAGRVTNESNGTALVEADVNVTQWSNAGAMNVSGTITTPRFVQSGGTLDIGGAVTVSEAYVYRGGTVNGNVTLNNTALIGDVTLEIDDVATGSGKATFVSDGKIRPDSGSGQGGDVPDGLTVEVQATDAPTRQVSVEAKFLNLGTLNLSSNGSLASTTVTISGTDVENRGTINLNGGSANANNRTIDANVINNATGQINIASGVNASFSGNVVNHGSINNTDGTANVTHLQVTATGYLTGTTGATFHIAGDFTNSSTNGAFNTTAATLNFDDGSGSATVHDFTNTSGYGWGVVTIAAGDQAAHSSSTPTDIGTLTVGSGASLDIGTSSLIFTDMTAAEVRGLLVSGFNAGAWNGEGINSSAAAANPLTAVGYVDNAEAGFAAFGGKSVAADDVLVKYTYIGDADLSGDVNFNDLTRFINGFTGAGSGWSHGDFDYNGTIDFADLSSLITGFNGQAGLLSPADLVALDAAILAEDMPGALAVLEAAMVPEPSLLALGGAGLLALRRRRSSRHG